jgi:hypothetical protein
MILLRCSQLGSSYNQVKGTESSTAFDIIPPPRPLSLIPLVASAVPLITQAGLLVSGRLLHARSDAQSSLRPKICKYIGLASARPAVTLPTRNLGRLVINSAVNYHILKSVVCSYRVASS